MAPLPSDKDNVNVHPLNIHSTCFNCDQINVVLLISPDHSASFEQHDLICQVSFFLKLPDHREFIRDPQQSIDQHVRNILRYLPFDFSYEADATWRSCLFVADQEELQVFRPEAHYKLINFLIEVQVKNSFPCPLDLPVHRVSDFLRNKLVDSEGKPVSLSPWLNPFRPHLLRHLWLRLLSSLKPHPRLSTDFPCVASWCWLYHFGRSLDHSSLNHRISEPLPDNGQKIEVVTFLLDLLSSGSPKATREALQRLDDLLASSTQLNEFFASSDFGLIPKNPEDQPMDAHPKLNFEVNTLKSQLLHLRTSIFPFSTDPSPLVTNFHTQELLDSLLCFFDSTERSLKILPTLTPQSVQQQSLHLLKQELASFEKWLSPLIALINQRKFRQPTSAAIPAALQVFLDDVKTQGVVMTCPRCSSFLALLREHIFFYDPLNQKHDSRLLNLHWRCHNSACGVWNYIPLSFQKTHSFLFRDATFPVFHHSAVGSQKTQLGADDDFFHY